MADQQPFFQQCHTKGMSWLSIAFSGFLWCLGGVFGYLLGTWIIRKLGG